MEKHFTFLGKTIAEIKDQQKSIGTGKGAFGSNLKTFLTSKSSAEFEKQLKKNIEALTTYNKTVSGLNGGELIADEKFNEIFKGADSYTKSIAEQAKGAVVDIEKVTKAQTKAHKASLMLKNGLTEVKAAFAQFAVILIASLAIEAAAKAFEAWFGQLEASQKKLEDLTGQMKTVDDEIKALTDREASSPYDNPLTENEKNRLKFLREYKQALENSIAVETAKEAKLNIFGDGDYNPFTEGKHADFASNGASAQIYTNTIRQQLIAYEKSKKTSEDFKRVTENIGKNFDNLVEIEGQYVEYQKALQEYIDSPYIGDADKERYQSEFDSVQEAIDQVNSVMNVLYSGGYLDDGRKAVAESYTKTVEEQVNTLTSLKEAATKVNEEFSIVNETIAKQATGVGITLDDYNALIAANKDYANCLEYNNGVMQINADKAKKIAEAKTEEQIAQAEANKVAGQTKYLENVKKIDEYKKALVQLNGIHSHSSMGIKEQINALEAENDAIADECDQYDVLIGQLYDLTGAYQGWKDAQNVGKGGDMLTDAKAAADYIKEVLTDNTSEDYMKVGRTNVKYQAALDFVLPDTVDREDEAAVEKYLGELGKFLDKDGTVMVDQVMKQMVDSGVFDADLAKQGIYKMLDGIKISDIMAALNTNADVTQGVLGMLSDYGIDIDVAPAISSFEDLQFYAGIAADSLGKLSDYEDLDIKVDVSDISGVDDKVNTLQNTIDEMNGIVAKPDVDTSDLKNAQLVIQYCQEQMERIKNNVIEVDTSGANEDIDKLKTSAEEKIVVNTDFTEANKDVADFLGGIPDEIKIKVVASTYLTGGSNPVGTSSGSTYLTGGARAEGTGMHSDLSGEPVGGRMLVGELGNEILVDKETGKWRTVGDGGAEFVNVPKGSIIFNHEQTQRLLAQGWVNSRGFARAWGTARANPKYMNSGASSNATWVGSANLAHGASVQASAKSVADSSKKTKEELKAAKEAAEALKKEYEKSKEILDGEKDDLEAMKASLEDSKDVLDGIVDTVSDRIDKEIDRLEHMWDDLKESLDNHKGDLDGALSAVQKILDDKIKEYEKAQDALDDSYQPRLDDLQDEIDLLNDKNDAQKEAIDLQKKKAALDAAKSAKTVRVYREGEGYVWETDQSAIDSAQEEYDDALQSKAISDLEKQKKALQKELDDKKQKIQDSIDGLNDYSEQWDDVSSAYADQINLEKLKELYGSDAAQKILSMSQDFYKQFLNDYVDTEKSIADVESKIEENQKQIDALNEYKDKWTEVADAYEKEQNRINTIAELGSDWEQKILGMRLDTVSDFKDKYISIMQQIEDKTKEIAEVQEKLDGLEITYKGQSEPIQDLIDRLSGDGYATGTLSATPGLHETDELGDELKIRPGNGTYSLLEKGTGVIPAKQTATLWNFANDPASFLSKYINLRAPDLLSNLQSPQNNQVISVNVGGITMQGVNDTYSFGRELEANFGNIMTQIINKR